MSVPWRGEPRLARPAHLLLDLKVAHLPRGGTGWYDEEGGRRGGTGWYDEEGGPRGSTGWYDEEDGHVEDGPRGGMG